MEVPTPPTTTTTTTTTPSPASPSPPKTPLPSEERVRQVSSALTALRDLLFDTAPQEGPDPLGLVKDMVALTERVLETVVVHDVDGGKEEVGGGDGHGVVRDDVVAAEGVMPLADGMDLPAAGLATTPRGGEEVEAAAPIAVAAAEEEVCPGPSKPKFIVVAAEVPASAQGDSVEPVDVTPQPETDKIKEGEKPVGKEPTPNLDTTTPAPIPFPVPSAANTNEAMPTVKGNPNYAAVVSGTDWDAEAVRAHVIADIARAERDNDLGRLCVVCEENAGTNQCVRCKAPYCSRGCQEVDWPVHRKVCAGFAGAMADDKRPSGEHRRVLYFPMRGTRPEVCWAVYRETEEEGWLEFEHPDLEDFLRRMGLRRIAPGKTHPPLSFGYPIRDRRIGTVITVIAYSQIHPQRRGMSPDIVNQSINAMSKPGYIRPWYGPAVFFADARYPNEPVPPKIRDINPRDVHTIARLLEVCDTTCIAEPALYRGDGTTHPSARTIIAGLRVNDLVAELNTALGVTENYDMTHVPLTSMYGPDRPIAMAFHLGLRWYVRPGNFVGDEGGTVRWHDGALRFIGFICNITEVLDGNHHYQDNSNTNGTTADNLLSYETNYAYGQFTSSIILLHGSGEPIDIHHVHALNAYLDEAVAISKGEPTIGSCSAPVVSEAGFRRFWGNYKKRGSSGPIASVPSPYKFEKKGVIDVIGEYEPEAVMSRIQAEFPRIWGSVCYTIQCFSPATFESLRRQRLMEEGRKVVEWKREQEMKEQIKREQEKRDQEMRDQEMRDQEKREQDSKDQDKNNQVDKGQGSEEQDSKEQDGNKEETNEESNEENRKANN